MKIFLPLVALALLACSASPSKPPAASVEVQPTPTSSGAKERWTLTFTAESTGERCELAKRDAQVELRCGDAAFAALKSDASDLVRLVDDTAWTDEAAVSEPEEAGAKRRSFRMAYAQGSVEVLRYAHPTTPFGRLAAALDALVTRERTPAPSAAPTAPRAFSEVGDSGLVTLQSLSLFEPADESTMRVAPDGAWARSGSKASSGKLDAKQLAAVRALVDEAGRAKASTAPGVPCDALPSHMSRILFGKRQQIGWSGPCAGPPPPVPAQILAKYLWQVADGRPASELEQTLALPR